MSTIRIGWIGLGNMGTPMAKNLVKAGFAVTVYNRTAAKATPLREAGAEVADNTIELWEKADIVITMVSDDSALRHIHNSGLEATAPAGKLVIDMSTVSPSTTRDLAGRLAVKGVEYLDAPVSGSVKPAELGQLVIMAGGKKSVYESALPIFDKLGKVSFYMGPLGAGNAAKLAINLYLAFNMQGMAESVNFARENGIQPSDMMAAINESALGNVFTKLKTPNLVNGQHPAAFALRLMAKDLRLAKEQGLHTPGGLILEESYRKAVAEGLGEEDLSAILKFVEKR
jgi:3-hydroxyisobutyrate dehydrogenase